MALASTALTSALVLASESALSLYPILIKKVETDLGSQIVARFATYSILAFLLSSAKDIQQTWGNLAGATRSSLLGLLTLTHVGASYYAFQELPAGISMSLFYSYPIFNILGAAIFFGEKFGFADYLLVAVAFAGVLLVARNAKEEGFTEDGKEKSLNWKGILAGLAAALTESGMYFAVRTAKQANPFYAVLELYPAALPPLLAFLWGTGHKVDTNPKSWLQMGLFNTLIGFVGYCLRFYAIPRLPTLIFSLLSFVGVIASFFWGWFFVGEIPAESSLVGAALITLAAGFSSGSGGK
jgi:drug/metabolite transporter (DMT)-like permease